MIPREGTKIIIEPIPKPATLIGMLAAWQRQPPLEPQDQFPEIEDRPVTPETIF